MQIIRTVRNVPEIARHSVVALGNFDGLHQGHRAVIHECVRVAKATGKPSAVLTFEPHPRRFFKPDAAPLRLMNFAEKAKALQAFGIDIIFVARFDASLAKLSASDFIDAVLVKGLAASHIVTGEDFVFGQGRGGNRNLLENASKQGAFGYSVVQPEGGAEKISSTRIRDYLAQGEAEKAAAFLGHTYSITGRVVHGDARGRLLGFPTANLRLVHRFLPKFGIYAVQGRWRNRILKGVANLGIRPMFATQTPLLEAHFFDFHESLYGDKIQIELLHYLRPEQRFTSEAELIRHMQIDRETAQQYFKTAL